MVDEKQYAKVEKMEKIERETCRLGPGVKDVRTGVEKKMMPENKVTTTQPLFPFSSPIRSLRLTN